MAKRPGPGPDDLDADLLDPDLLEGATPDDVAAALTDELDLHSFQPRECADVVAEYLHAAHEAGMTQVRIVHGKGTGTLRRIVHGVLDRHPAVQSYRLADERAGAWGATLVELRPAG
jgi:dsDNA-specific endonuclease/ATPase MutS2